MEALRSLYSAMGLVAILPYGSVCGQQCVHSVGLVILAAREHRNSLVGGQRGGRHSVYRGEEDIVGQFTA